MRYATIKEEGKNLISCNILSVIIKPRHEEGDVDSF